jgi:predicted nucleic acid-binding protein
VRLLLDTGAYSDLARGHAALAEFVRDAEAVLFSSIVAGELLGGFRRGARYERNLGDLRRFLEQPRVQFVDVTWTTAERYARIHAALRLRGTPIPTNDMWIAAQAMETGAELFSTDPHFEAVEGLALTNPGTG